jgi:hypothetical protein
MGLLLLDISGAALLVCEVLPDACHLYQAYSRVDRNATVTKSYDRTVAETAHAA